MIESMVAKQADKIETMGKDIEALKLNVAAIKETQEEQGTEIKQINSKLDELILNDRVQKKILGFLSNGFVWKALPIILALGGFGGWAAYDKGYHKTSDTDQKKLEHYQTENAALKARLKDLIP